METEGSGPKPEATPQVKALNCPNCGAALAIRSFEHALNVVCGSCHSILDAKDPNLKILQTFQAAQQETPLIPLGTRGKLRGDAYEAIGFQKRTIEVEGTPYSWYEYLLFNPFKGFRYVTEYNGHWNDVKTVRSLPQLMPGLRKQRVEFLGEAYTHFQRATARTTYVLGEFPWQVRVGEAAEVNDYVSPPRMLSSETTEGDTVWSLGEYMPGTQVWQAFQLPGSPPLAQGVFANQPSPYQGKTKGIWRYGLAALLILLLLGIFSCVASPRRELFEHDYSFDPRSPAEPSLVTDVFEVTGHPSNVEVSIHTNLSNNWAYFNLALINEETGQAYDFGREVSYYSGRDSDGPWTEGSTSDQATIPSVSPGRYYLRIEPEMDKGAAPMSYTLRVRSGVPSAGFFLIAALALLVPPCIVTFRSFGFEQRRWQESDYETASQKFGSALRSGGDDDDS